MSLVLTVNGAFSLLLTTTQLPAATIGAALLPKKMAGQFHGMMAAATPNGCRSVRFNMPGVCRLVAPCGSQPSPAFSSKKLAHARWSWYAPSGRPIATASRRAIGACAARSSSASLRIGAARAAGERAAHAGCAAFAAATAALVSATLASWTAGGGGGFL